MSLIPQSTMRRAQADDAEPLAALFQLAYGESSHPCQDVEYVRRFVTDERNINFVDVCDGAVVAGMGTAEHRWHDACEWGHGITHPSYRRAGLAEALMSELRWTAAEAETTRDGLSVESLECAPSDLAGLRMCRHWPALELLRQWGGGRNLEKMSRKAVAAASVVGLLTMPAARPADYFTGGRAVERLWLTATELGLAFHPMTALPYLFARLLRGGGAGLDDAARAELPEMRRRYKKLFHVSDARAEVMLFRVSQAAATEARSLRRRVDDVLVFAN